MNEEKDKKVPWWMTLLIVVVSLPVLAYPWALSHIPAAEEAKMLVWLYPAYVIVDAVCAWLSYPRRPEITWILIVMMLLSHLGMYVLLTSPVS